MLWLDVRSPLLSSVIYQWLAQGLNLPLFQAFPLNFTQQVRSLLCSSWTSS